MAKGYKTGGRKKGTPNKSNPIKGILMKHSEKYFTPRPRPDLTTDGGELSDFDVDMMALDPVSRVSAELKIMEFHTPKMKSQDINVEVNVGPRTIEDTLARLCGEEDEENEEE